MFSRVAVNCFAGVLAMAAMPSQAQTDAYAAKPVQVVVPWAWHAG